MVTSTSDVLPYPRFLYVTWKLRVVTIHYLEYLPYLVCDMEIKGGYKEAEQVSTSPELVCDMEIKGGYKYRSTVK